MTRLNNAVNLQVLIRSLKVEYVALNTHFGTSMYINCNKKLPMNELKPVEIKKEKISGCEGKLALFKHEMSHASYL